MGVHFFAGFGGDGADFDDAMARRSRSVSYAGGSAPGGRSPRPPSGWSQMLRGLILRMYRPRALLVAAGIVGLCVLAPRVPGWVGRLADEPAYQIDVADIHVSPPHAWVPRNFLQQALDHFEGPSPSSLLDGDLLPDIAGALDASPWVDHVESVRKLPAGGVDVRLTYRRPVAFVTTDRGVHPVDRQGVLLPVADFSIAESGRFIAIHNITAEPTVQPGQTWDDRRVVDAARLAEALNAPMQKEKNQPEAATSIWQASGIVAIEVAGDSTAQPGTSTTAHTLSLISTGGREVIWGSAPGTETLEPSTQQKLGKLRQYLTDHASLDEPTGHYRIDLRPWNVIALEAIPTTR